MSRQSFVIGALILLSASFVNRIIGFIYQIVMIRLIKPEGIGLFNMVFPLYILVLVLATMGIPVAIAKLVAEEMAKNNVRGANRVFKISLSILILSSVIFTALLVMASPLLMKLVFPNPKVYYIFLCLIPGIIVVSICSAFRGYFQGLQQMTPTAITQTLEQIVRVVAGLCIAYLLLPKGVEYAAVGASLGVVIGEFTGCLTMIYLYFTRKQRVTARSRPVYEPFRRTIASIFGLGVPVTLTRFVSTLLMSADAVLIPQRLQAAGMSVHQATSVYGQLVGIAETLLFTPTMITIALATALVPAISDALALENHKLVQTRTSQALRITIGAGLPCTVAFLLLPKEMCGVLFGYADAGIILAALAFGGPFLYFQQTTTGILQGMGEAVKPFKNLVIASVFKILGLYYLTAIPSLGILGSALALNVFYVLIALLNYLDLNKLIGYRLHLSHDVVKPFLSALGMAMVIWQIKLFLSFSPLLTLIVSLVAGCLVYVILLFLLGGIHRKDFLHVVRLVTKRF
ncbi:stage V sporulation protein B [Desulforamulus putei]|uniref:stage V sporulation protein B n=1 Tax=Desulforamulus putei TaxID=74701 RepID=UPI002FDE4425